MSVGDEEQGNDRAQSGHLGERQVDKDDAAAQDVQPGVAVQQPHRHAGREWPDEQR
jgi:hypothetical protein